MRHLAIAALLCLASAAPAAAAPQWGVIAPVSSSAFDADVASDGQGNAVVVWEEWVYLGDGKSETRIHAAFRSPGGAFSAPQQLSASGQKATDPRVAMDAAGNAAAVWVREDGTGLIRYDRVQGAVRPAGGAFGAAETLSESASVDAADPDVAIRNGQAVAVWDGPTLIEAATASLPGGFTVVADLSTQPGSYPRVVIDASGNALAVWRNSSVSWIQSAFRPAGGAFAAAQTITTMAPTLLSSPEVAFDPAGRATAVWESLDGTDPATPCCSRTIAAVRSAGSGGTWGTPVRLSTASRSAGDADVIATSGETVALWRESASNTIFGVTPTGYELRSAAWANGTSPDPGTALDVADVANEVPVPELFGGRSDAVNVVFKQRELVRTAYRPAGGPFEAARTLFTAPDWFDLGQVDGVATGTCDGLVVWRHKGLNVAVGDTDGNPTVSATVPTSGQTGTAVAMSASAGDGCSVPAVTWAFGDGGTGAGNTVSHVYSAPGTYTVTATARDAAGNSTATTRSVVVAKATTTVVDQKDATAPVITAFTVTRSSFRVGGRPTAKVAASKRAKAGTTFAFTVSEAGAATIALQRKVKKRYKPAGRLQRTAAAGANKVVFSGRVGETPLATGTYRATLKVADAAGNVSAPRRVTFRVVKR